MALNGTSLCTSVKERLIDRSRERQRVWVSRWSGRNLQREKGSKRIGFGQPPTGGNKLTRLGKGLSSQVHAQMVEVEFASLIDSQPTHAHERTYPPTKAYQCNDGGGYERQ